MNLRLTFVFFLTCASSFAASVSDNITDAFGVPVQAGMRVRFTPVQPWLFYTNGSAVIGFPVGANTDTNGNFSIPNIVGPAYYNIDLVNSGIPPIQGLVPQGTNTYTLYQLAQLATQAKMFQGSNIVITVVGGGGGTNGNTVTNGTGIVTTGQSSGLVTVGIAAGGVSSNQLAVGTVGTNQFSASAMAYLALVSAQAAQAATNNLKTYTSNILDAVTLAVGTGLSSAASGSTNTLSIDGTVVTNTEPAVQLGGVGMTNGFMSGIAKYVDGVVSNNINAATVNAGTIGGGQISAGSYIGGPMVLSSSASATSFATTGTIQGIDQGTNAAGKPILFSQSPGDGTLLTNSAGNGFLDLTSPNQLTKTNDARAVSLTASGNQFSGTFAGDGSALTNVDSPFLWGTNMYYIDGISGSDSTAKMGDPHFPAKTWNFACTNLQSKFPAGSYVVAAPQQFSNSPSVNASGWTIINISNNFAIYGNGCTLHSVSNSHFLDITCTNFYCRDVTFSTTNNVQSPGNRQGYCLRIQACTNGTARFDNCSIYCTIDGIFTSGNSVVGSGGTQLIQFNNSPALWGGWNIIVDSLQSLDSYTNIVWEFNNCKCKSDPELINQWGSGRVTTLNSSGLSQWDEATGSNTYNFNYCTLDSPHGTNGAFPSVSGIWVAQGGGGLVNFKQCVFNASPAQNTQETNIVGNNGWTFRFWNCAITNAQSICTNSATVTRMSTVF